MSEATALVPFDAKAFVAWAESNPHFLGGPHHTVEFVNGYGASIIRNWASQGMWELAVTHRSLAGSGLCYAVHDIRRYDDEGELREALFAILRFPANPACTHARVEAIEP